MSNPCKGCQSKIRFIRHMNGNYMHSVVIPEYFGRDILGSIKLEAPNGNIYDVGVTVKMNTTLLQSGWRAFVDANQIEENYCLMFRYRGTSQFEVTIFDSNGKEKVPCRASMGSDNSSSSRDGAKSSAGEGSDSTAYSSKELAENNPSLDDSMESVDLQVLSNYYVLSGLCDLTEEQLTKLHALVGKIKPEIPVLVVLMKKSNVNQNCTLIIRKDYAREYFPPKNTTIILQLPGKSNHWNCKFYIRPSGMSDAGRCNLCMANFVRDNHVRKGDIFLLQPITKVKGPIFTVTVHLLHKASIDGATDQSSAGEGSDSDGCPKESSCCYRKSAQWSATAYSSDELSAESNPSLDDSVESDDLQMLSNGYVLSVQCNLTEAQLSKLHALVGKIKPEIPVFVVLMKKSNVKKYTLIICKDYARKYFPRENTKIILQLPKKGKHWNCKLYIKPSGRSDAGRWNLSMGNFVRDNHVREGDIFLLQPVANIIGRIFTVTVHLLHKASIDSSPERRTDIGLNHRCASTKMASTARVKEEPTTDGEETSSSGNGEHGSSDNSEEDSEPRSLINHGCASTKMGSTARVKEEPTIDGTAARVKEEPTIDAEEISSSGHGEHGFSDNFEEASEPRFLPLDTSCLTQAQEKKMMEKVEAIGSELPIYFKVINKSAACFYKPTPNLVFSSRYISRYLAEKYGKGLPGGEMRRTISLFLLREGKSRTWSCQLRRTCDRTRLDNGWPLFARDNHLQEGDLCLFEVLTNEEQLKMVVYIIRRDKC